MSERFTVTDTGYIYDNQDKAFCPTIESVVKQLNDLNDENQQIKEAVWSWSKSYNRVYEENQQIKATIKERLRKERTHIGQSVLRQLLEAIE